MKKTSKKVRRAKSSSGPHSANQGSAVRVPHDSVNEMVLIAAVIVDEGCREKYLRTISADMMFGTGHALIWTTLQQMEHKGLHYDPATVKQLGGPDLDVQYVEGLIQQRPAAPPNINHHVEMLKWDAARIATAKGPVTRFLELLKDPKGDPTALRSTVKQIEAGLATGTNRTLRVSSQVVAEQMIEIRERRVGKPTYGFGIPGLDYWGPNDFDETDDGDRISLDGKPRLVPGTAPKMTTVVTGVSGSGKTTGTLRGIHGMWAEGRKIAVGAYEQGSGMSLELLAAFELGMSRQAMMAGEFDDQDELDIEQTMERIGERVVFDEIPFERFTSKKGNPNARAIDRIAQAVIDSRCEVYVADLFKRQLKETDPDEEERALMMMQQLAKDLNVHFILVQQQRLKDVEGTKSKLPRRDSIKGSAAWVEMPDTIIGWHRPALWKNVPDDTIFSMVLKQRHGKWPIQVKHEWDPAYGLIGGGETTEVQFNDQEEGGDLGSFFSR